MMRTSMAVGELPLGQHHKIVTIRLMVFACSTCGAWPHLGSITVRTWQTLGRGNGFLRIDDSIFLAQHQQRWHRQFRQPVANGVFLGCLNRSQ